MKRLPEHVEAQLRRLVSEGLPVEKISFMMRLDRKVVEAAIQKLQKERVPEHP